MVQKAFFHKLKSPASFNYLKFAFVKLPFQASHSAEETYQTYLLHCQCALIDTVQGGKIRKYFSQFLLVEAQLRCQTMMKN